MSDSSQRDVPGRGIGHPVSRRALLKGGAAAAGALLLGQAIPAATASAATPGMLAPGTTVAPYLVPLAAGVQFTPMLTVGDLPADNGYAMAGIPDGLGAFKDGRNITLLMNHEIGAGLGVPRAHGSVGSFVSQWTIDPSTLRVLAGRDLVSTVHLWDTATSRYVTGTTAFNRLCSADLPDEAGLSHEERGTSARIFLNGEESNDGRAWAHVVTGSSAGHSWQLPRMGRMAFENLLTAPSTGERTVIMLMDDGSVNTAPTATNFPCELSIYVGAKQSVGNPVERAGLTNGKLYGIRIKRGATLVPNESDQYGLGDATSGMVTSGRFELVELGTAGDVSQMTALELEQSQIAKQITRLQRIEDGAWDPRGRRDSDRREDDRREEGRREDGRDGRGIRGRGADFYFVTTASFATNSRLWRLRFDDLDRPEAGGSIEILLTGGEGQHMFDNIAIDRLGRIILQEDPGNQAHLARVWLYGIESRQLIAIAQHNPDFFQTGGAKFITQDEESSGVIDAREQLGEGWFLLDVQGHKPNPNPALVEYGQLLAMYVNPRVGR